MWIYLPRPYRYLIEFCYIFIIYVYNILYTYIYILCVFMCIVYISYSFSNPCAARASLKKKTHTGVSM